MKRQRPLLSGIGGVAAFAAAVLLCLQYRVQDKPLLADTQHYFYLSERAASGVAPHVSHVDSKTMLSSLITGGAIYTGRQFEIDDVVAAKAASVAFVAGSIALLWLLGFQLGGGWAAAVLCALAGMAMWPLFQEGTMAARPKVFLFFFLLLSLLRTARRQHFRAGLAGMAAFLCWQPGLLAVGAAGLAALAGEKRWRSALTVVAGAAVGLLAYQGYFWWKGALHEQLYQTFILPGSTPLSAFDLRSGLYFMLYEGRTFLPPGAIVSVIAAVTAVSLLVSPIVDPTLALQRARQFPGWLALVAAAVVGVLFTCLDHQGYPDLLLVMPYSAVLAGCGAAWLLQRMAEPEFRAQRAVMLSLFVALFAKAAYEPSLRYTEVGKYALEDQRRLGHLTSIYLESTDKVWVSGCTHLLAFNRAANHVPYGFFYDDIMRDLDGQEWRPLRDGEPPEIILISRGIYPEIRRWLLDEYEHVTPKVFSDQQIRVYRRKVVANKPKPQRRIATSGSSARRRPQEP